MTREDLVRLVRDCVTTSDVDNPITFDPPEWALRAVQRAYTDGLGQRAGGDLPLALLGDQLAELRDALTVMLDQFGDHLDKHELREYRALARGPAADGVPDAPIEGGA